MKRKEHIKLFDSFSQYQAEFRRQMGIDNDQALELLYQTVSMKSVGNLTEFVRSHMLESTDAGEKVNELSRQFDNLNRAHEAVLKARQQIDRLAPMIDNCNQYESIESSIAALRQSREALYGFFADKKITLLTERIQRREQEQQKLESRLQELRLSIDDLRTTSRELERAIDQNGGQRLSELKTELERLGRERNHRQSL